ncbi:MAG TPA: transglycosylase SLT domain-containing protein [Rhodopila sp.]|nr:transglycosylase SLT domain-containing protein [Rhodopila sp.]
MSVSDVVSSILRSSAPTLLTAIALPPPFNLIASGVVSTVLSKFLPPNEAPAQTQPGGATAMSPDQVTSVIEANAGNPAFLAQLREAEQKLREYEAANDLKFAELAVKDKTRAGDFQIATGSAPVLITAGMVIVGVSIVAMLGIVVGSIMLISGNIAIPQEKAQLAVGVFGLIGAVVGYISGYASQIIGFYYGSSQSSKDKTDALASVLQQQGQQIGQAAAVASTTANIAAAHSERVIEKVATVMADRTTAPAADSLPAQAATSSGLRQGPFGGVRWRLTSDGIIMENETNAERTVGEPVTVRRIWHDFGPIIKAACATHGVPAEMVVTTIAVESRGIVKASLMEPDGRTSIGLMQTLTGTASEVMGRPVTGRELETPEISIEAGTRYIAKNREVTNFDPILVAAAYNAGSLQPPRPEDTNPFRLRSTGDHLIRTKLFYNDTVATAKAEGWFA